MLKKDFIQRTKLLLGDEFDIFAAALETEPPVSIRINPCKSDPFQLNAEGRLLLAQMEKIPWCTTGYYLPQRPSFTYDPLFHAGAYYVQEASSMFLEQAVLTILADPRMSKSGIKALDLCAAPGGKSTHLLTLLPNDSLLVSNEIIRNRSLILAENIAKWGNANVIITQNDPKDFGYIPHFFDVIVADLPCSGEGLFRKYPEAANEWSIEQVKLCASRQRRIIRDVWRTLKPGGYLIYSTCTFNAEENEDNIEALSEELGAEILPIPINTHWNISDARCLCPVADLAAAQFSNPRAYMTPERDLAAAHRISLPPVYRFFPHRTRGEGFFLALLRKKNDAFEGLASQRNTPFEGGRNFSSQVKSSLRLFDPSTPAKESQIKNMLSTPEKFVFRYDNPKYKETGIRNMLTAIPVIHESAYATLSRYLKIIAVGLPLGETKGKDFIPSAWLALSTELNIHSFPSIELTYKQAISYLKKELIDLPPKTPKGHLLVNYQHIPLGFVKNTETRANNMFPREWRIRR